MRSPAPMSLVLLARLVRRQVPRVDDPALGGIDLPLVLDMLKADLDAILGPDDVLLAHALRHVPAHLSRALVDMIAHKDEGSHDDEEDDEREKLAVGVESGQGLAFLQRDERARTVVGE